MAAIVTMAANASAPMGTFESWLLRRAAQAVEAGEVPAAPLTEVSAGFEASRIRVMSYKEEPR